LGEFYSTTDPLLTAAEIVTMDYNSDAGVLKSSVPYDPNLMGVISTKADIVMGSGMTTGGVQNVVLGLAGRVPVKVTAINGIIKPGDYITSSSIPGVGMKATKAGQVVGQALTGWNPAVDDPNVAPDRMGIVILFIQKGYYNGAGLADLVAVDGLDVEADPTMPEMSFGDQVLSRFMTAQAAPDPLDQDTLQVSELLTDRVAAAIEIITPKVITHALTVDSISSSTGDNIDLTLSDGGAFILKGPALSNEAETVVPDQSQSESDAAATRDVITFDYAGNAYFAGTVTATAISADSITGLDIFADRIAVLSDAVESLGADEDPDTVTASDLINVRDMVAMVSNYTTALAGQTAGSDANLIARLDTEAAAQLLVNNSLIDGLAALDLRVAATEASLLANATILADLDTRLLATESQVGLSLTSLDLAGDLTVQGLTTFAGGIAVDTIGSLGSAISFMSDQIFIGRPYFNADTGGFAVVRAGATEVRVNFIEAYLTQPVVQSTVTFDALDESTITDESQRQALLANLAAAEAAYLAGDIRYAITDKSATGFTIVLSQPATTDLNFSWIALAVQNARLDESVAPDVIVPEPEPEPVIEPVVEEGVVDPFSGATPDNLNPDFAPLEDNLNPDFAPLEDNLPLEPQPEPILDETPPPAELPVEQAPEPVIEVGTPSSEPEPVTS
jgi:hypothetical protein